MFHLDYSIIPQTSFTDLSVLYCVYHGDLTVIAFPRGVTNIDTIKQFVYYTLLICNVN